jgi:hypothetical protein
MDEHLKQLEEVLCVLRSNQLFAKIRKASVGVPVHLFHYVDDLRSLNAYSFLTS